MSYKLKTIALTYSFAQAAAAGSTTFFSVSDLLDNKTYKIEAAASTAALFFILESINAWNFQGQSILNSNDPEEDDHNATHETPHTWKEKSKQSVYLLFDALKTFTNRYFLLASLNDRGIIPLEGTAFWLTLLATLSLKKPFDLTNETYEATKSFLSDDADTRRPFYHNKIECIQRSRFFEPFIIAGSAEHAIGEAVIPTLLILYENDITLGDLGNSPMGAAACAIVTFIYIGLIGQTYLFEGKHTKENLRGDGRPEAINVCCRRPCQLFLYLMGPAHGLESGAGIYFSFINAIENNHTSDTEKKTYKILLIVASALGGFFTAVGTHYSEVQEAQRVLEQGHRQLQEDIGMDLEQPLNQENVVEPRRGIFCC